MKIQEVKRLIREAIEKIYEAGIQYQEGNRVEIDSSYGGGIGTIVLAKHPYYAIKFDQTGTTDSFHFSDLKPFNDEEENAKNADIDTGLDENLTEEDRCKRIADRRYDKPSAYKSGAIVRCRKGNIWKDLKEIVLEVLQEDESLHKWFNRSGPKGKEGGWVDCNAPDGKGGYKACGRKEGEKRSKYPYCRPTPAGCKRKVNEAQIDKIYHVTGILIVDDEKRNQKDILSDVRALPGITVVRNIEMEQDATSRYFRSTLEIKIDPYPYAKQGKFDDGTIQVVINNIKNISGVIGFKQTENVTTTND